MKSNLRKEIKSYIVRQGMTMQEVVDLSLIHIYNQPDATFTLAALADEHEHLLPLSGGQQAVTQKLLQGGNILRLQQFG